jgi:hypothetical protein
MAMSGAGYLELVEYLNECPEVRKPLTGVTPTPWNCSDVYRLVFGGLVRSHRSIPAGYQAWLRTEGVALRRQLACAEAEVKATGSVPERFRDLLLGHLVDQTSETRDPNRMTILADQLELAGVEDDGDRRFDIALRELERSRCEPLQAAGMVMYALGKLAEDRRNHGLGFTRVHPSAYVDDVATMAGCSRCEARRALMALRWTVNKSKTRRINADIEASLAAAGPPQLCACDLRDDDPHRVDLDGYAA